MSQPKVIAVSKSASHTLSKENHSSIEVIEGLGVNGDAHMGKTVKHRSRVKKDPSQPNLRQVHLIHEELFTELKEKGFDISPGQMGENITTSGISLLELPKNTILKIANVKIKITGLRNPCYQLDGIQQGLMKALVWKGADGNLIRKAGVMGVVETGGTITVDDNITISFPNEPFIKLEKV